MTDKQAFSATSTLFQKKKEGNNISLTWAESDKEDGMKKGPMSPISS